MKGTSIVIRALNEEKLIGKLLYALSQQTTLPNEIILVDSGSTDRTLEIASSFEVKIIHIAKADFSFGRALNLGCKNASQDILVFVSAHVYPTDKNWLRNLIEPFEDNQVASTYGKQRGNFTTKFSEHQLFYSLFPENKKDVKTSYFCNNANCAIRRDIWIDYPYDEKITGLEDLAWAKQQYLLDKKIVYVPNAEIIHVHDESWSQVRNRYRREAIALKNIEPEISINLFLMIWLIIWNVFTDYISTSSIRIFFKHFTSILLFRINQYYGTFLGFRTKNSEIFHLKATFYYPKKNYKNLLLKKNKLNDNSSVDNKKRDDSQYINYP